MHRGKMIRGGAERTASGAEGRDWGDTSTSQGTPKMASKPPEPSGEPCTGSPSLCQFVAALDKEYGAQWWDVGREEGVESCPGGNQGPHPFKYPWVGSRPGWSHVSSRLCRCVGAVLWQPESLNRNDVPSRLMATRGVLFVSGPGIQLRGEVADSSRRGRTART